MISRVLIIEDEPDIRKTIDYNLSKESFQVFQAGSIAEGEQSILDDKPDVIILDLMLPDGSGLTLCRDVKSNEKTKHIPIILLTAKADEVDRVIGFELWGYSAEVTTRTVDTHIKRLREKLGSTGEYIQTIRGVGYRFSKTPN